VPLQGVKKSRGCGWIRKRRGHEKAKKVHTRAHQEQINKIKARRKKSTKITHTLRIRISHKKYRSELIIKKE
jgi:hypothetical protein